jgi:hypothetical protein
MNEHKQLIRFADLTESFLAVGDGRSIEASLAGKSLLGGPEFVLPICVQNAPDHYPSVCRRESEIGRLSADFVEPPNLLYGSPKAF